MEKIFDPLLNEKQLNIINKNRFIIQNMNKVSKEIFFKELFEKIESISIFEINTEIGIIKAGDVLFRPLEVINSDCNLDFNHYGIFLGELNNEILILDNNQERNIGIVNLETFLSKHNIKKLQIKKKPENIMFSEIIERAKEIQFKHYSLTNFNCAHFANYCITGDNKSDAIKNIVEILTPLLNIFATYLDYKSNYQEINIKKTLKEDSIKIKKIIKNIEELK